jgi:hypothetical protein
LLLILLHFLSIILSKFIGKTNYEKKVYEYSLTISNYAYMGYALMESVFGAEALADMIFFCIPFAIYTYTVGYLKLTQNKISIKRLINPMTVAIFLGIFFGLLCDVVFRKSPLPVDVETLCEQEDCHCAGGGIVKPALFHSVKITCFVLLVTLALNSLLAILGEDFLSEIVFNRPILGPITSAFVGLVPNCSASVAITQLYIDGAMSFGSMMAGTLSGAGVGLLVLFRINHNRNENLKIVTILYVSAVVSGILLDFFY